MTIQDDVYRYKTLDGIEYVFSRRMSDKVIILAVD